MTSSGVQVVRVISGDHELTALDFQKHYRLNVVHLMDTDRTFEKQYNRRGWPFLMIVDAQGQVVYTCNNLIDNDPVFKQELQKIKQKELKPRTQNVVGISYMASTIENNAIKADSQNDRFTSIAAGSDGGIYAVYTSVRNGNSDILMRTNDGKAFTENPVSATQFDEYDAAITTDGTGKPWICWTSNQAERYNIFMTTPSDLKDGKAPIQITTADDDAMHGRLICDASNAVWITYYRWRKMSGNSRDKEIYVRRYAEGSLSTEIQISPTDVPSYEDHTDPAITCLNDRVVIAWSWDYHKPDGYPQDCESPTIFARSISPNFTVSKPFPLSGQSIDSVPALSAPIAGRIWCAWDLLEGKRKSLCVRSLSASQAAGTPFIVSNPLKHLCSPSFAFYKNQKGTLIWA
ncbi:MAG: hypothetical protein ABFD91_04025, partial [Anaerohalosphaeraceae bacterium]